MKHILLWLLLILSAALPRAQDVDDVVRFAVIGDMGTGDGAQYDVGRQMASSRAEFPFNLVLMLGDNLYRRASPQVYGARSSARMRRCSQTM